MKSLYEIDERIRILKIRRAQLDKKKEFNTQFQPGELDGHSETYSHYEDHVKTELKNIDDELAILYKKRTAIIKEQYGHLSPEEREIQNQKAIKEESLRKKEILSTAKEIYEEKMDEYMQKNFIGKAKMIFSGKKPKFMKTQEINKVYGDEAVSRIISPEVNDLIRRKEEQLKKAHELYANDPQKLEYAIKATNDFFDSEITKINAIYNDSLDEMNLGGNSR